MQVVDHEPHAWFLLRDGDTLLLDVDCSHGAVGYVWTMVLTAQEVAQFRALGRDVIAQLAERVQSTAPGVVGNRSPYLVRKADVDTRQRVTVAIKAWIQDEDVRQSVPES
ncbi:hypothetical protein SAMN05192589_102157 [Paracidovorax valerianellae]|uniref:Uncharacterized protein n=1 Tax=Paracidovorax valerianellae TaxID=187868 RepID=A0A1G6LFU2_9BURK|nr:hypothetical protein [Paracidovorax valerianellae]SDC42099.1 hypothetical protein SAMN05192589_102157 [Paracidovorax valerianellae]